MPYTWDDWRCVAGAVAHRSKENEVQKLQGELTGKLKNGGLTELINHVGIPQALSRPNKEASSGTAEGRPSETASARLGIPPARYLEWRVVEWS